jgi:rhodanese-related sulfurtransferase
MSDRLMPPGGSVSVAEVAALLRDGAVLLDVREDDEWADGHAAEAVHVPMWQLSERAAELPKDQTIVCVCHVGGRSAVVADALNGAGWTAVNLTGGMDAWERAGLPVVRD